MKNLLLVVVCVFLVFALIHYLCKIKKPFKRAFLSLMCGPSVLVIVNLLTSFTGVLVPVTLLSVVSSLALGIPGVALMTLFTVIF